MLVNKQHVSDDIGCHDIVCVVATLGGGAFTTLRLGAATLGAGGSLVLVVRPRMLLGFELP